MTKPVKVLLVEDSEDDAMLALRALRRGGFEPASRRVQTAAELESALAGERWDAVISDFNMPGFTGMDALRIIRSTGLDIPFILISGTVGEETAVLAMKAGASDYVMKNSLARLAPALDRELMETQMRAAHAQTRRDLIESEARFIGAFEHAPIGIALVLPDGQWLKVNRALCKMVGYSEAELLARTFQDITYPDDLEADLENVHRMIAREIDTYEMEKRYVHARGNLITVLLAVSLVRDDQGQPQYFISQIQDISMRKDAEKHLAQQEGKYRGLLEAAPDAMVVVNQGGEIVLLNAQAEKQFGYRRDELVGQKVKSLIPEGFAERLVADNLRSAAEALLQHIGTGLELIGRRKDGSEFPIEIMLSPLESAEGILVTAAIRDISVRKVAENRIVYLNRVHSMLSGISSLIVRVRDRDELFREACRIAVEHGAFLMAWIGVVDKEAGIVKPVAFAGDVRDFFESVPAALLETRPGGPGFAGRAVREMKPAISNDIRNDPRRLMKKAMEERGINSLAVIPLIVGREAIGVFSLYSAALGFFDDDELKLLIDLVGNMAFAIENFEKAVKLNRMTRVNAIVSATNEAIVRIRDRQALFEETCRIAVEQGRFKMAWIGTVNWNAMRIEPVASAGSKPEYLEFIKDKFSLDEQSPMGDTMTAQAIRGKKILFSNDAQNDPRIRFKKEHVERGTCSVAALPLLVSNEAQAVLVLYTEDVDFFDTAELNLLRELARNIAFAIDHIDKQARLDYLAYYDALTGLANRSLFLERLPPYMRGATGGGHKLAVFLLDLERFRSINDSLGRPAGDELLKQVAQWLTRHAGDASLLARVGPDEFAVVLPEVKQEGNVARLLEKTQATFLEQPFRLDDAVFRISFKAGVALFPGDGADAETLFRNAEAALKKAKASGERYLFYTQKMNAAVAGKLTLENQLREALDKEEFVLHYQPKVSLESGKLTSAEALIRWHDPRTGLVPPGRFIPVLEETGLIYDVGRWALRKALEDYLRWRAAGLPAVRIAVNVSPLQLRNHGFIAEIQQVIGIDPHAAAGLELELTESLIMEDIKHSIASLKAIRAMGVTIAIDDFGTGFSSLSYLAKLPVDTLKIDRSFVIDMTAGPEGLSLVSTIVSLAHALSLKVVAEGVETDEQSRLLRLLGCDEMQGFLYSKPVPGELFEANFLAPAPASATA